MQAMIQQMQERNAKREAELRAELKKKDEELASLQQNQREMEPSQLMASL